MMAPLLRRLSFVFLSVERRKEPNRELIGDRKKQEIVREQTNGHVVKINTCSTKKCANRDDVRFTLDADRLLWVAQWFSDVFAIMRDNEPMKLLKPKNKT